jgi:hypothetical protein
MHMRRLLVFLSQYLTQAFLALEIMPNAEPRSDADQ